MTYNIKKKRKTYKDIDYKLKGLTPSPYGLSHVKNEFSLVGLQCSLRPLKA